MSDDKQPVVISPDIPPEIQALIDSGQVKVISPEEAEKIKQDSKDGKLLELPDGQISLENLPVKFQVDEDTIDKINKAQAVNQVHADRRQLELLKSKLKRRKKAKVQKKSRAKNRKR